MEVPGKRVLGHPTAFSTHPGNGQFEAGHFQARERFPDGSISLLASPSLLGGRTGNQFRLREAFALSQSSAFIALRGRIEGHTGPHAVGWFSRAFPFRRRKGIEPLASIAPG